MAQGGRLGVAEWSPQSAGAVQTGAVHTSLVPLGDSWLIDSSGDAPAAELAAAAAGLLPLPAQEATCSAVLQDHAVGIDACLLGRKGSGKTAIVQRFGALLGYEPLTVYCERE